MSGVWVDANAEGKFAVRTNDFGSAPKTVSTHATQAAAWFGACDYMNAYNMILEDGEELSFGLVKALAKLIREERSQKEQEEGERRLEDALKQLG